MQRHSLIVMPQLDASLVLAGLLAMAFPLLAHAFVLCAAEVTLPDPSSFASIGWLVIGLLALLKGADLVLTFWKKHIAQSVPLGDYATSKDLSALRTEVHNRMEEISSYNHEQIHDMKNTLQFIQNSGESGREGLHSRLGTVIEVVAELRGKMEGLAMAVKTSSEAATTASQGATRAADRAEELARRISH